MIRTYYWNARILGKKHFLLKPFGNKQYYYFKNGNAGDLFAKELLEKHYGLDV